MLLEYAGDRPRSSSVTITQTSCYENLAVRALVAKFCMSEFLLSARIPASIRFHQAEVFLCINVSIFISFKP